MIKKTILKILIVKVKQVYIDVMIMNALFLWEIKLAEKMSKISETALEV